MRFSIVIPTIYRIKEIDRLLESLLMNQFNDFEVIIVDQNTQIDLTKIISKYNENFKIKYFHVKFRGGSRARNYGAQHATGEIINFADDDAEYSPKVLSQVDEFFKNNIDINVMFCRSIDKITGKAKKSDNLGNKKLMVTKKNLYKTTIEYTMFIEREKFKKLGCFDETLGVGTKYGAEEGADFFLRCLYSREKMIFNPSIIIYHSNKEGKISKREIDKAYSYGRGFGRLVAKHFVLYERKYEIFRYAIFNLRSMIAVIFFLVVINVNKSNMYYSAIRGRLSGFSESYKEYRN